MRKRIPPVNRILLLAVFAVGFGHYSAIGQALASVSSAKAGPPHGAIQTYAERKNGKVKKIRQ